MKKIIIFAGSLVFSSVLAASDHIEAIIDRHEVMGPGHSVVAQSTQKPMELVIPRISHGLIVAVSAETYLGLMHLSSVQLAEVAEDLLKSNELIALKGFMATITCFSDQDAKLNLYQVCMKNHDDCQQSNEILDRFNRLFPQFQNVTRATTVFNSQGQYREFKLMPGGFIQNHTKSN